MDNPEMEVSLGIVRTRDTCNNEEDQRRLTPPPPLVVLGCAEDTNNTNAAKPSTARAVALSSLFTFSLLFLLGAIGRHFSRKSHGDGDGDGAASPEYSYGVSVFDFEVTASLGAAATDDERCSDVAVAIMRDDGGNAVDAAVAAALCLGVVSSSSSGLGGGGFMLVHIAEGAVNEVIDAREVAPKFATRDMFVGSDSSSTSGGLSIGVPGELAGLELAWERHGSLPWSVLFQPAIALAEESTVDLHLASSIKDHEAEILADESLCAIFCRGGVLLTEGDTLTQSQLATTLRAIATQGASVFYEGEIGRGLVADISNAAGNITLRDLNDYRAIVREPLITVAMGHQLIGAPPPASGGLCVGMIVAMVDGFAQQFAGSAPSLAAHRFIEAAKHAFALRLRLGDPDFAANVSKVVASGMDPEFVESLRAAGSDDGIEAATWYGGKWRYDDGVARKARDHGTSSLSIVDANRNGVAFTTTINTGFGSKVMSASTGIILNNQMDDFSTPGEANIYGLAPSEPNFIAAGKRPLSSMSPTVVLSAEGKLRAVVGASGGPRIITAVATTVLEIIARGASTMSAVMAPRVHSQLFPDVAFFDNGSWSWESVNCDDEHCSSSGLARAVDAPLIPSTVVEAPAVPWPTANGLETRGHNMAPSNYLGVCQAVTADGDTGMLVAASDPRKNGIASGY